MAPSAHSNGSSPRLQLPDFTARNQYSYIGRCTDGKLVAELRLERFYGRRYRFHRHVGRYNETRGKMGARQRDAAYVLLAEVEYAAIVAMHAAGWRQLTDNAGAVVWEHDEPAQEPQEAAQEPEAAQEAAQEPEAAQEAAQEPEAAQEAAQEPAGPALPWERYEYNRAPYWSLRIGDGPAGILVARLELAPGFLGHWHWDVLFYPDWIVGQWPPLAASGVELGHERAGLAALAALSGMMHPASLPAPSLPGEAL